MVPPPAPAREEVRMPNSCGGANGHILLARNGNNYVAGSPF